MIERRNEEQIQRELAGENTEYSLGNLLWLRHLFEHVVLLHLVNLRPIGRRYVRQVREFDQKTSRKGRRRTRSLHVLNHTRGQILPHAVHNGVFGDRSRRAISDDNQMDRRAGGTLEDRVHHA